MSRFEAIGHFVYEKGDRIGCTPDEAAVELARKLNAYQMRVERLKTEIRELKFERVHDLNHIGDLQDEVGRLINAGDALGSALILFELKSEEERQERLKNWAIAKYGEPRNG
jgi:hypothetical protein